MTNSVHTPHTFSNILKGTGSALRYRIEQSRRWFVLLVLCFFTGFLGLHRFAVKKRGTGILYLLTLGFLGLGVITDLAALVLTGRFADKKKKLISSCLTLRQRISLFCLLIIGLQYLINFCGQIPFIVQIRDQIVYYIELL